MVEFFHISKTAGTSLCQVASANGCTSASFVATRQERKNNGNCLIAAFDDGPRWASILYHKQKGLSETRRLGWEQFEKLRLSGGQHCAARRATLLASNWTFYANEYALTKANESAKTVGVCANMLTIMAFRPPRERLLSHMRFIAASLERYYERKTLQRSGYLEPAAAATWRRFAPAVVDNYYVRSLTGEHVSDQGRRNAATS